MVNKNTQRSRFLMSNIPENTNLQQITLFEKRKIVEHNDLITSVAKMDKVPLKIFELAVSCIDINNPPKDNIIYLSKKELFSFFKVVDNDKHSRFKEAIEKMQKQAYFQIREKIDKGFEFESIIPIPYIKWNDYDDEVTIRFDIAIMPYLIDLKQNFTQYALSDIMELNSKYSIILYKWLSMNYNQYLHYKDNGGRRFEQLEAYRNPSISIPDLRSLTDTVNEYKEMSNFTRELLNKPIEEINKNTHFNVGYEKIKKGRSIDSIQFHISKKVVAPISYKEEQQDKIYLEDKLTRERTQQDLFAQAVQSKYTTILLETMLIGYKDVQNLETMSGLQKVVYPLYDDLKKLRGLNGVTEHLEYVRAKQVGYSNRNIVKYLKVSIEQYLPIVKRQDLDNE